MLNNRIKWIEKIVRPGQAVKSKDRQAKGTRL